MLVLCISLCKLRFSTSQNHLCFGGPESAQNQIEIFHENHATNKDSVAPSHEVEIKTVLHKRENDSICISR